MAHSTKALNFQPTEEEQELIDRVASGDVTAEGELSEHNILFLSKPGLKGFVRVDNVQDQIPTPPID